MSEAKAFDSTQDQGAEFRVADTTDVVALTQPETLRNPPVPLETAKEALHSFYDDNWHASPDHATDVKSGVNGLWNLSFKDVVPMDDFFTNAKVKVHEIEVRGPNFSKYIEEMTMVSQFIDESHDAQLKRLSDLLDYVWTLSDGPNRILRNEDFVAISRHIYFMIGQLFYDAIDNYHPHNVE